MSQRVVWVSQTFSMGGAEVFTADLLAWLNRHGWPVVAYVTHRPFAELLRSKGLRAHHLPIALDIIGDWKGLVKVMILFLPALIQYSYLTWHIRQSGILLMSGYTEKIIMTWLARLTRQPVVWIEFGPLQTVFTKFLGLPKLLYFSAKNLPHYVIVPSTHTLQNLIKSAHISLAKLQVIACASDIRSLTRRRSSHLIVCVSRLEPGKGQDILLTALARVKKTYPDVKLQIVGSMTQFGQQLRQQVRRLKLEDSVELTGHVADVRPYLAQAQLAVFPSVWPLEGFGLVMIEAMASGTPVVAFRTGPAPEILDSGRAGFLVDELTASGLAQVLINSLRRPTLAEKIGQIGRQRYLKNYRFDQVGPAYEAVLRRALADSQIKNTAKVTTPQK